MTMDYKYIEQLLDRYFECQTSLEEEQILRAFFAQKEIPVRLLAYRELFIEQTSEKTTDCLGADFDQRILSLISENEKSQPLRVKARVISMQRRLTPLYKAAACVAVVLALGQAAQMPYDDKAAEQQENLARSLEQMHQIQQDRNAVAKSDSANQSRQTMATEVLSN